METEHDKNTCIPTFLKQVEKFREHVAKVERQYAEMHAIKSQLSANHMVVQMDLAENYNCKNLDEIQSAYFNKVGVTLQPIVAYYRSRESELVHQSYIVVSDELSHASSTVIAIINNMIPHLKNLILDLNVIHYTTGRIVQPRNTGIRIYSMLSLTITSHMGLPAVRIISRPGTAKGRATASVVQLNVWPMTQLWLVDT